jgi:hypothetical protein
MKPSERHRGVRLFGFGAALALCIGSAGVCEVGSGSTNPAARVSPRVSFSAVTRVAAPSGRGFYVSPGGSSSGSGTMDDPWDLATALSQPSSVHPGDTIWLRGGTYRGIYESSLTGSPDAPIVVRQYPGERATLDGGSVNTPVLLTVTGAYVWFWGFEVTSSSLSRTSTDTGSYPTDLARPYEGIANAQRPGSGVGTRFINLVVHDLGQGFGFWQDATDAEISGCLIYYNGWDAPDRGHGHGIYSQNLTGTKTIRDNVVFANFSHGIHAYADAAYVNNFRVEGNTLFQSGVLSAVSGGRNLLIGGETNVAQNPTVTSDLFYRATAGPADDFNIGFNAGASRVTVMNNYVADNTAFNNCSNVTATGNAFYGTLSGLSPSSFPDNTYLSQRPTGALVFVRPNSYEPGRANVTVYNWDLAPAVNVDLGSVLPAGSRYEIRNAQNFFGPPVLSGTYRGGVVSLPMAGLAPASPAGLAPPLETGPTLQVFVVLTEGPGRDLKPLPEKQRPPTRLQRTPTSP